jgi:hypothetical protein
MIASSIVDKVVRLLAEGRLSQRAIAHATGISRGTVASIAQGKRPRERRTKDRFSDPSRPLGPPRRCPGCGGLVYLPCLLCRIRQRKANDRAAARGQR